MVPPKSNQTIRPMTVSELRKIIHDEFEKTLKSQIDEIFSYKEECIKQNDNLRATVTI